MLSPYEVGGGVDSDGDVGHFHSLSPSRPLQVVDDALHAPF